jgi:Tol biopolymer transport system component
MRIYKKFILIILLCHFAYPLEGCTSQKPPIVQQGVAQLGPSGYGFRNTVWSPDGAKIIVTTQTVVSSWNSHVSVLEVSTGKLNRIFDTDAGSVLAVSWSPDGKWILLASGNGGDWIEGIWKISFDEKKQPEFLVNGYQASWSAEGKRIAVFTHSPQNAYHDLKIKVVDLETRREEIVFSGKLFEATGDGLAWSPDGKQLIFD